MRLPGFPTLGLNPRESGREPLDLPAVFGNDRPIVLEIGSGKGRFLLNSAKQDPERNFVGVERSLHYYRVIVRRLKYAAVCNAIIVNDDAFDLMRDMLSSQSVSEVHIYFPDPWPRKREQKRRIARREALLEIERILRDDGWGVWVTDHRDYFEAAVPVFREVFDIEAGEVVANPPRTNYEAKYQEDGRPIFEIRFRKRR